jgi:dihydrofolate reductase
MYCTVVIGRRSFEILGGPLPGRPTIVLTRQADYAVPKNVRTAGSLTEALQKAKGQPQVFILGGQEPYREAIEGGYATDMLLTRVHASPTGDAYFPRWDEAMWKLEGEKHHPADDKNAHAMTFQHWTRKP